MSLKTNKLREENPTKLLLARGAARKGIVCDATMTNRIAADIVMESMKVETLAQISRDQDEEIARLEKYAERIIEAGGRKVAKAAEAIYAELWPDDDEDEDETSPTDG
jgi:hypothetical protein